MPKPSFPIALILAAAAAPVTAAESDQPAALRVFYGDLNLATQAGAETLDRRIRQAVSQLCAPRDTVTMLTRHRCRAAAQTSIASQRSALIAAAREERAGLAPASH